jgi:hypothetical protein
LQSNLLNPSVFSLGNGLPYIAVVYCYALTSSPSITVTNLPDYDLQGSLDDQEAPHYQIDFCGLNAYCGITDPVKKTIRVMINKSQNSLFTNHPHEYGVDSVRQMLLVFAVDQASQKWYSRSN